MDLTEAAEEKYIQYLREHGEARGWYPWRRRRIRSEMRTILTKITPDRTETEKLLERAQRSGDSRWVSILMDTLAGHGRKTEKGI